MGGWNASEYHWNWRLFIAGDFGRNIVLWKRECAFMKVIFIGRILAYGSDFLFGKG